MESYPFVFKLSLVVMQFELQKKKVIFRGPRLWLPRFLEVKKMTKKSYENSKFIKKNHFKMLFKTIAENQ